MRPTLLYTLVAGVFLASCSSQQPHSTTTQTNTTHTLTMAQEAAIEKEVIALDKAFPIEQRDPSQFPAYVELLKQHAAVQGIKQSTIDRGFANIYFLERVVKADKGQPEKRATVTLASYLKNVLPQSRINAGVEKYKENQATLDATSQKYGVPPQFIVSLWGLESGFGRSQGKEDVISALATLSFEGRRETLFSKQLLAALEIMDKGYIPEEQQLKGSWAGAMGQSQFMPTSYLSYAADGDGDGKMDIWNNKADVFASIANYLSTEGWQAALPWGYQVTLPADFNRNLEGVKTEQGKSVQEWEKLGVKLPQFAQLAPDVKTWVVIPDDPEGRTFLVTQNFRTIMHWNRSYYFALSVCMMADGIATKIQ
ncbi:Membrane-bound lytic murein transglycosylase B precursor [Providencia rustigianii]|uniref:Membrane-bound lytic murein transglycosylase B n=1 Tax=Providencia rustigianii TaxID=158850 RepID=A0A379G3J9_9GAMM|nr:MULTISPECIES: lytic murein transglycosylase [Providencia]MTC57390.1 lytic murein transglycosylase [Providencia rustigianii]SPY77515.1 Membrane-bound lytic murein transglycosylase B precursor [Providencia rustigianii]SUC35505.1 Membrane-bound lytic murein transglycosylase B precursor [Providencia rustigianii]VEB69600.1 Membrane-bound lytic murein transglycosylase B precursor [Providencia rustigianii]